MSSPVYLRIYDLSNGFVKTWSPLLLFRKIDGMWHTGVHVFGYEYFYGGGIVKLRSSEVEEQYDMTPVQVDYCGDTKISQRQFERHLLSIRDKFHSDFYDLTRWNCNHFADYILKFLVGKGAPEFIVNMPDHVESTLIGRLVISAIKKWSDGEAMVHSDDPMHPKSEMLELGEQYIKKSSNSLTTNEKSLAKKYAKGGAKLQIDDVRGPSITQLDGKQKLLPPSPSLRMKKTAESNRLELIDYGWLGTPNKNAENTERILIGSPCGLGRSVGGIEPWSPPGSKGLVPTFGIPSSYAHRQISPLKPDELLPTPPSARYAHRKSNSKRADSSSKMDMKQKAKESERRNKEKSKTGCRTAC